MTNDIFCVGLTRTELQTLGVLLPITFRIIPVSSETLDHTAVVRVINHPESEAALRRFAG